MCYIVIFYKVCVKMSSLSTCWQAINFNLEYN